MIKIILLIILGFFLLIKGADLFVDGISSTAINIKIPKIIISLTLVAFGTSTPELFISFRSILSENNDVVIANVVGSTIVNTMFVIGVAALIRPIRIKNETIKKQLPLHLTIISTFGILFLDEIFNHTQNTISRFDAILLLLLFLSFLFYIFKFQKKNNILKERITEEPKWNLTKSIIYSIIGLVLIYFGSNFAVDNCVNLANALKIPSKLVTMIILVIGTSSPELIMAITSVRKKEYDIIIGNIIGTNIFNIGFVLALPIAILGNVNTTSFNFADIFIMIISATIIYLFAKDDKKIDKLEGLIMISIFIIYYAYLLLTLKK